MTVRVIHGDCREILPTLDAGSVQCCVTSPPYLGLRDYNVAGQIGLEPTPDAYIAEMVAVFREVRRVLRDDGTLFLNLGDSYASTKVGNTNGVGATTSLGMKNEGSTRAARRYGAVVSAANEARRSHVPEGYKPKDLLMMPARVALALQADGWWLRSDIIWAKPNPMPESVTDRPTSAHEHVFLLTKQPRYFWDAEAVKETNSNPDTPECAKHWTERPRNGEWPSGTGGRMGSVQNGRNMRNVWTIATAPYPAAHFATFPPELAERCIKAGTSERGCCAACGAPWVRQVERTPTSPGVTGGATPYDSNRPDGMTLRAGGFGGGNATTTGWSPSCHCDAETQPCTVLDPFGGAGTTGLVADRLGRHATLIELSPSYTSMASARITDDCPLFAEVAD